MSNGGITEQKELLRYIIETYREQIKLAMDLDRPSKINIDYILLNQFYNKQVDKDFLQPNFEFNLNYVENRLNKDRDDTNHISLKLVEVPQNCQLHDLDASHNGKLISTKAMIKNITPIQVKLKRAVFECSGCMSLIHVDIDDSSNQVVMPSLCSNCGSRTFHLASESSEYRNVRYVKLEEPLELRGGGNSREFKAYMQDYLASPYHKLKPGDVVDIVGTFNVERTKPNGTDFEFLINLHNITPVDDAFEDYRITESDKEMVREMAKDPKIYDKLVATLMPEVYGYEIVKEGILLSLFEGNRPIGDSYKSDDMDRWTIHILLIGDPGIGKSQIITAVKKRAPKIITIAGTTTSQAGLTTSAVKDELTGTWALEAGAVVLADTGMLCIDEYDKLTPAAQKSLNEPMEQLAISSAKANIVQTMTARTSILACANPKYSRFNRYKSLKEQIDIPESNLSRFDLVFALHDNIDEDKDRNLASNLLNKENFINESETLDDDLFKKYITIAKMECFPILEDDARQYLVDFYVKTRQSAKEDDSAKPITTRDLMALERLTIAKAKTRLSNLATREDAENAVRIYSVALATVGLTPETAGELEQVYSNNEVMLVNEAETMINTLMNQGGILYDDILRQVKHEIGVRCHELGCSVDDVFDEAVMNVEKNLK